jgi:hypothetical protein
MNIYLEIRKVFGHRQEHSQRDKKAERPKYGVTQNSYDRYGNYNGEHGDRSNDKNDANLNLN